MEPLRVPPICNSCYRSGAPFNSAPLLGHITRIMKGALKIGLALFSLLLLGSALFSHPMFFIPAVCALMITGAVFILLGSKPAKVKPEISRSITMEQVNTLLRISNNHITAKRLASTTNTPLETAEKYLHALVVEGKLEVYAGELELIYTKGSG